jgi:hypothetical protein
MYNAPSPTRNISHRPYKWIFSLLQDQWGALVQAPLLSRVAHVHKLDSWCPPSLRKVRGCDLNVDAKYLEFATCWFVVNEYGKQKCFGSFWGRRLVPGGLDVPPLDRNQSPCPPLFILLACLSVLLALPTRAATRVRSLPSLPFILPLFTQPVLILSLSN